MKKTFRLLILVLLIAAMLVPLAPLPTADAALLTAQRAAEELNKLGLFSGVGTKSDGTPDYALDQSADRQTATTMLVRLIGKEDTASKCKSKCKFTDVSSWAKKTVAWANDNGYVNGYSSTKFGGKDLMTAQMYLTLVLRALGYKDEGKNTDFSYKGACEFATKIGINDGTYSNSTKSFTRGDIAKISYAALNTTVKGTKTTLYEKSFGSGGSGSTSSGYTNSAPGTNTAKSSDGNVIIDYSNVADGYVMVKSTLSGSPKLAVQVIGDSGTPYNYLNTSSKGVYEAFPLTEGSGSYTIKVLKNTSGTRYTTLVSTTVKANITDELSPFLRPCILIDYNSDTKSVVKAEELCKGLTDELEKVQAVYNYVIKNFTYDYDKAATVQSGYRPVLNTVWEAKKGICYDYSATMASMLRSQGVAVKMIFGYTKEGTYHAWISVYTKKSGWVEAVIYFDGSTWKLMDPTFASTGNSSKKIMDYINNAKNYSAKYVY